MKKLIEIIKKIAMKLRGDWDVRKVAERIMIYRRSLLAAILLVTLFFAYEITRLHIATDLDNLLPQNHQYIKLHHQFKEKFGGTNLLYIMVSAKEGDIFNPHTLGKVAKITEELQFLPGMDRYKVISLGARKVKNIRATAWGLQVTPLMWPEPPQTEEGLKELKQAVFTNDTVYGSLVSIDNKHALILGEFFDRGIDYKVIFREVRKLCDLQRDAKTDIAIAGEAMIRGYIYSYLGETKIIFAVTAVFMVILLFLYTRSVQKTVLPIVSLVLSVIWGLGFIGTMGYYLDPLFLVVPFFVNARTISHAVQFNERFDEELRFLGNVKSACQAAVQALFIPGIAGILVDVAGILVLVLIPIPILQTLGIICVFMALTAIFTVFVFNPIVLSYVVPEPKAAEETEIERVKDPLKVVHMGLYERTLAKLEFFNNTPGKSWGVIVATVIICVAAWFLAERMVIGDVHPGSPLLRTESQYNKDAKAINEVFMGLDTLRVVFMGVEGNPLYKYSVLHHIEGFQRYMKSNSQNVGGSLSIVDILRRMNSKLQEDNPKFMKIPHEETHIGQLFFLYLGGSEPGDLDMYESHDNRYGNITVYAKDHRASTIQELTRLVDNYVAAHPMDLGKLRIAGGVLGTLGAGNELIMKFGALLLFLTFAALVVLCGISFRSILAGILLLVPLAVSTYMVYAYMGLVGIGMNINTLPVATVSIGIGVDYGIYLYARLREEYVRLKDLRKAFKVTLVTTCKAITFTALTIALGVVFFSFSSIKFQAEMGFLLTLVTFFHMLGTLILLPALVLVIKPKFITEVKEK